MDRNKNIGEDNQGPSGDSTDAEKKSWTCRACGEANPNTFEVCWQCGLNDRGDGIEINAPTQESQPRTDAQRTEGRWSGLSAQTELPEDDSIHNGRETPSSPIPWQVVTASLLTFASVLILLTEMGFWTELRGGIPIDNFTLAVGAITASFLAIMTLLFLARVNWARVTLLVLWLLGVALMVGAVWFSLCSFRDFFPGPTQFVAIQVVNWALQFVAMLLLFVPRSDRWFERKE
jgi:hypothetical protein